VTGKLGWSTMIKNSMLKIRNRVNMIRKFRLNGFSSPELRRKLFMSFVLPLFTWLFPIFPLFTRRQQEDLSHFYYTCLKRTSFHLEWADPIYAYIMNEISLEDRVSKYWEKYLGALSHWRDGFMLLEQLNWSKYRSMWVNKEYPIKCLHRSKRFVNHIPVLERCVNWCSNNATMDSIPIFEEEDTSCLSLFPETFL
jgi:hypothetical protein